MTGIERLELVRFRDVCAGSCAMSALIDARKRRPSAGTLARWVELTALWMARDGLA